jgi:hypothetical protein
MFRAMFAAAVNRILKIVALGGRLDCFLCHPLD